MGVRAPRHNAVTTPLVAAPLGMANTQKMMDLHVIKFNRPPVNSKALLSTWTRTQKTLRYRNMKEVSVFNPSRDIPAEETDAKPNPATLGIKTIKRNDREKTLLF